MVQTSADMRVLCLGILLLACDRREAPHVVEEQSCPPLPQAAPAPAPPPPPAEPRVRVDALLSAIENPTKPTSKIDTSNGLVARALQTLTSPSGDDALDRTVLALVAAASQPESAPLRALAACTLASVGLHSEARGLLQQLRAVEHCAACTDALAIVGEEACKFDDADRAAAGPVTPSPVRAAAEKIMAAINSGDVTGLDRYLDAGTVEIGSACSVCDFERVDKHRLDRRGFLAFVGKADERMGQGPYIYHRPELLFCDGQCCSGPTGMLSHTAYFIDAICFRGPANAPKLARLDVTSGG